MTECLMAAFVSPPGVHVIVGHPPRQEISPSILQTDQASWPDSFPGNLTFSAQINPERVGPSEPSSEVRLEHLDSLHRQLTGIAQRIQSGGQDFVNCLDIILAQGWTDLEWPKALCELRQEEVTLQLDSLAALGVVRPVTENGRQIYRLIR